MARGFIIPGEAMVAVKGPSGSLIANLTNLGLASDEIKVTPKLNKLDVTVNAWGDDPVDVQQMGGEATITMNLVHVDRAVLDVCILLAMGLTTGNVGTFPRAGRMLGGLNGVGGARFAANNCYIGLNISSPIGGGGLGAGLRPWRFYYAYLADTPVAFPVGVQRSIIAVTWRAITYTNDPWGGGTAQAGTVAGTGKEGAILWDHVLDV